MNRIVFSFLFVTCFATSTFGQNFFWSTFDFGEGAFNGDFRATFAQGESATVFLYYDAGGTQNITEGIDLDITWSNLGVAAFTAAETFEYDISIAGVDVGDRWGGFAGPAESVTADDVTGLLAVNVVNGEGIQIANLPPGSPFIDDGYDETADAFLVGSLEFDVLNLGKTSLLVENALVVDGGQNISVPFSSFSFGIPEPSSAALLVSLMMRCVTRRSKRDP